jgi:hypothetical protein
VYTACRGIESTLRILLVFGAYLTVFLTLRCVALAKDKPTGKKLASIGVAEMKADHSIILQLRSEGPKGELIEGYFVYPTEHPDYAKVLAHVGPLVPGQSVFVRPWPEEQPKHKVPQ